MKLVALVCSLILFALLATNVEAQCANGQCRGPVVSVVADVVKAPVKAVAKVVDAVIPDKPVRALFQIVPKPRRVLGALPIIRRFGKR